jgi:hypothetical protein
MIIFQTVAVISAGIIFLFGLASLIATYILGKYDPCDCGRMNKIQDGWSYCPECNRMKQK